MDSGEGRAAQCGCTGDEALDGGGMQWALVENLPEAGAMDEL
jgi:hypothetical protein